MHRLQTRQLCFVVAMLLLAATLLAQPADQKKEEAKQNVDLLWGVKIPLRDGVKLNATIYKPANHTEPVPVIFTLTPYIGDSYHERAMYFAANGYVYALVD